MRCSSLRSSNRGAFLAGFVLLLLGSASGGERRNRIRKNRQVLLQLLVALGDPSLVGIAHLDFLP